MAGQRVALVPTFRRFALLWSIGVAALAALAVGAIVSPFAAARSGTSAAVIASAALAIVLALRRLTFRDIRQLMRQLQEADEQVARTAQDLKASASQILSVARQTEGNAADEAAAVDETLRTMKSLLAAANEIAEAADLMYESAKHASDGSATIAERTSKLNEQAHRITDVLETIKAIADKSDILALNASLEGAKAGEAGRGFVLVGSEMRRLAEMVMGAVGQIKQLAQEIQELSRSAVTAAEDGRRRAVETTVTSERITMITNQQRSGTEQVSESMNEIQEFTQQALSGAKQAQATADDLVKTAEALTNILEDGAGRSARGRAQRGA